MLIFAYRSQRSFTKMVGWNIAFSSARDSGFNGKTIEYTVVKHLKSFIRMTTDILPGLSIPFAVTES